jgi:predicted MPP superfamily phosphohydrolase
MNDHECLEMLEQLRILPAACNILAASDKISRIASLPAALPRTKSRSMSFLTVFVPSLILTAIVGAFLSLAWRVARRPWALAAFLGFALFVHLVWSAVPLFGAFAPAARWLAIFWLGSMLAALMLIIPFAMLAALSNWQRVKAVSANLPVAYVSCFLVSGFILSVTSTASFELRQVDLPIAGLPAGLDGFRIANLGDVHIGRFIDGKELSRGIKTLNDQKVDLLVVTGDLVDDVKQLENSMRVLERSNTPNKIIAILGNHEEMGDLPEILSIYDQHKARISLLVNESTTITHRGATLHIVGVDYPLNPKAGHMSPHPEQDAVMSAQANTVFAGIGAGETILALSHHPAFFPFAAAHGAKLTLASHTHGGQLRLFGRPFIDAYPYLQGVYRRGNSYLDVSAGFGHWLPIRFGVPREIVIVTLHSEPPGQRR